MLPASSVTPPPDSASSLRWASQRASSSASVDAWMITTACTGGFPGPPSSHVAGALSSVSPRMRERCGTATPSRNSVGNVQCAAGARPHALRPGAVNAKLMAAAGLILRPSVPIGQRTAEVIDPASLPIHSRAAAASFTQTKRYAAAGRCP